MNRRALAVVLAAAGFLGTVHTASASTIQLFGVGSAVGTIDATANFESTLSLFNNPYIEDGLSFRRVGLSNNNDGCGFAGCGSHPGFFPGFSGNYFYGANFTDGLDAYISVEAPEDQVFTGLELQAGTGFDPMNDPQAFWETYMGAVLVGSGTFSLSGGATLVGFLNPAGFTSLHFAVVSGTVSLPAIDSVTADLEPIPEPSTVLLLGAGLAAIAGCVRRRRA